MNEEQVGLLIVKHGQKLRAFCAPLLPSGDEPDDAINELVMELCKKPRDKLTLSYLKLRLRGICRSMRRKAEPISAKVAAESFIFHEDMQDTTFCEEQLYAASILDQLKDTSDWKWLWSMLEGNRDVAAREGIKVGCLYQKQFQARKRYGHLLNDMYPAPA